MIMAVLNTFDPNAYPSYGGLKDMTKSLSSSLNSSSSSILLTEESPKSRKLTTPAQSFSNALKATVGTGICAIPAAFAVSGVIVGIGMLICAAVLSAIGMIEVIDIIQTMRRRDYRTRSRMFMSESKRDLMLDKKNYDRHDQAIIEFDRSQKGDIPIGFRDIAQIAFSNRMGRIGVDIALLSCQIGGNISFVGFLASALHSIAESHGMGDVWTHQRLVCALLPAIIAICLPRSTAFLAPFAFVGNLAILGTIITVVFYAIFNAEFGISFESISALPTHTDIRGAAKGLGIFAFSLLAHAEIMAIEHDSQDRTPRFRFIIIMFIVTIVIVYMLFGISMAAAFGTTIESNILVELHSQGIMDVVKLAMSAAVFVMLPMSSIPASNAIESMLNWQPQQVADRAPLILPTVVSRYTKLHNEEGWVQTRSMLLSAAVAAFTVLINLLFDNFGLLVSVVGAVTGGALAFVLPPMMYARIFEASISSWTRVALFLQQSFGILLMATGVWLSISSV